MASRDVLIKVILLTVHIFRAAAFDAFAGNAAGQSSGTYSHLGCYSSTFAKTQGYGYKVDIITWDVCVRLCIEKDEKYAGIEARLSYCYCGNQLRENSDQASVKECDMDCYGDPTKNCGGTDRMSLYLLKDSTTYSFLATTLNSVGFIRNNVMSKTIAVLPKTSTIRADYHYTNNLFIFSSKREIYSVTYEPVLRKYTPRVTLWQSDNNILALTVDWYRDKVYWCVEEANRTSALCSLDLDGGNFDIHDTVALSPVTSMFVDPYLKGVVYTASERLWYYEFATRKFHPLLDQFRFEAAHLAAIDVHRNRAYVVGHYIKKEVRPIWRMVEVDYSAKRFAVLFTRNELKSTYTMTAIAGRIFWAERDSRNLLMYEIPKDDYVKSEIQHLTTLPQNVESVRLFHEHAQTMGYRFFCAKKKCSHECVYSLEKSAACRCPADMNMGPDRKTCQAKPLAVIANPDVTKPQGPQHNLPADDNDDKPPRNTDGGRLRLRHGEKRRPRNRSKDDEEISTRSLSSLMSKSEVLKSNATVANSTTNSNATAT